MFGRKKKIKKVEEQPVVPVQPDQNVVGYAVSGWRAAGDPEVEAATDERFWRTKDRWR